MGHLIRRETLPAGAAVLQMGLTQSVLLASLPLLVVGTGVSYQWWSWFLGGTLLVYVLAAPWWGRRIDRRGPGDVQILTAAGTALSNLLLAAALFVPDPAWAFALILLSRIGYALFASGQYPSSQAAVIAGAPESRIQAALGELVAINHGGRLLGPLVVGLFAAARFQLPIVFLALLGTGLAWVTWALCRPKAHTAGLFNERPPRTHTERQPAGLAGPSGIRNARRLLARISPALAVAFLVTFSVSYLLFGLSYSLAGRFSLAPAEAAELMSQVLMLAAGTTIATHLVVVRTVAGRPVLQAVLLTFGAAGGGYLLLGAFSRLELFAAIVLLAVGHGLSSPAYTAWARNRHPAATGGIAAVLMSVHTLGHGLGTLVAGALEGWQPLNIFSVVLIASLLQAAIMFRLLVPTRSNATPRGLSSG